MNLERFIPALLIFLSNRLSSTGTAAYMRAFGIGVMEFRVMVMLATEPEIAASRIVEVIGLDKGAVSRTLKALEEQGLVLARLPRDRRRPLYTLSTRGYAVHDRALAIAEKRQDLLLDGIPERDRERLIALLHVMLGNVGKLKALSDEQGARRPPKFSRR